MFILLSVKLIWCRGFPEIYAQLQEGGVGSVCHEYMFILLSVKLIWCRGFPEIYAWLVEGMGSVCHEYMFILLSVNLIWCRVFQRSMLDWWRGWDQSAMGICSLFYYVKCIQCSGVPEIYDWLLMGSRCGRAVLTLAQLARGPLWCIEREIERDKTWAVNIIWISVLGICALYYMWNLFSVMVCQRSMLNWRGVNMGCTLHLKICPRYMCIHCSICETYLV